MLAQSQDQVRTSIYTCQEIEGNVKVYWKGLMKKVNDKEMLTLTVSGSNDQAKQTPIAIDAFFKFLDVLEINNQKVTGDVCSMNCTGKRKGKEGKGEVVGVKFAEVWMNAATVSQNVSDSLYADCKSLTDNVQDPTSLNDFAIIRMLLKCDAILAEIVRRGKLLQDEEDKVELRKVHGKVSQVKKMIEEEKNKRGTIVDDSEPLPF